MTVLPSDTVTTARVASSDGTSIGYLRQGTGPAVVLVQGAMADVHAYRDLATAMSSVCTVIRAERRGRGLSPRPFAPDHALAREVEDIDAVLAATGAECVFGLSSGGVIALEAARTLDRVRKVAVYEPPFYSDGISSDGVRRLDDEIERGAWGAALLDALTTAGTAPALLDRAPRPLARILCRLVLAVQARQPGAAESLSALLPGVRFDFAAVTAVDGRIDRYAELDQPVLLLSGTAAPRFLREAVASLAEMIPGARRVDFPGLGHDGPWNSGGPTQIAATLAEFFTDDRSVTDDPPVTEDPAGEPG